MRRVKISIIILVFLLLGFSVFAAQMNSTSYKQNVIVSTGGENTSTSSYKINIAMGIISRIINSTSYINRLGFFHTILFADGQPCTSAGQCEGGFCCSSVCQNSACPVSPSPTPSPSSSGGAAAGGGGGGGGGGLFINATEIEDKKAKDFSINPDNVKEHLALGATKTKAINIKNIGDTTLNFNLNVATVNDFVFLSENSFRLDAGQEKYVEANIIGKKLGSYIGEIKVSGDEVKKSINIIIEVEPKQALFDVKLDIPSPYK